MKGGAATLTGPTARSISGGRWAGRYEFVTINLTRMKNALEKRVTSDAVVISYEAGVRGRATATQEGGMSRLQIRNIASGNIVTLDVNVQPRSHLGVAEDYARLGFKTDVEHIMEIFEAMVDRTIG